jgi:hypothetical protein
VKWRPLYTAAPIRSAKAGQLSIYGSPEYKFSRVVIAVSFEEEALPVLSRQVYYHYLDRKDDISITDHQVEFTIKNTPSSESDINQEYKKTLAWSISFKPQRGRHTIHPPRKNQEGQLAPADPDLIPASRRAIRALLQPPCGPP